MLAAMGESLATIGKMVHAGRVVRREIRTSRFEIGDLRQAKKRRAIGVWLADNRPICDAMDALVDVGADDIERDQGELSATDAMLRGVLARVREDRPTDADQVLLAKGINGDVAPGGASKGDRVAWLSRQIRLVRLAGLAMSTIDIMREPDIDLAGKVAETVSEGLEHLGAVMQVVKLISSLQ